MAKLLFGVLMTVVWWMLHALQLEEEMAIETLSRLKHAVNQAAHAAAQQLDRDKLEMGLLSIDAEQAELAVAQYLKDNLALDEHLRPLPGSLLRQAVEVRVLEVLDEHVSYPYTYQYDTYDYEVTFKRPGVVLIVHAAYPLLFGVLSPIEWEVRGSSELVY